MESVLFITKLIRECLRRWIITIVIAQALKLDGRCFLNLYVFF